MTFRVLPLLVFLPLAACATAPQVSRGAGEFQQGVGAAVTAPLEDLNVRREAIPAVLLEARRAPYASQNLMTCEALRAEVALLDDALGPDFDSAEAAAETPLESRAAGAALDMVRDTTTDFIPLRSWVRRLSGAEQHSRTVQAAIRAGLVRRGYLKGLGQQRNCAPPAAPSSFRPG
ncbi:hypothetical protein [Brevundimonas sp.]|uniref:hypothetical protein n=1 Tax=Brevundimonas sp. TaxID=1871086 RepID=UPI0035B40213